MENYKLKTQDDKLYITLGEHIDEESTFDEINIEGVKEITVDFGNLISMNSCGVREFIKLINKVEDTQKLVYINCPYLIASMISIIPPMCSKDCTIESVVAHWCCTNCEEEEDVSYNLKSDVFRDTISCKNCSHDMETEIDWDELINLIK